MNLEDKTAARLAGYNCMIKFRDGEELFLKIDVLSEPDPDDEYSAKFFEDVEEYMYSKDADDRFPHYDIAVARDTLKYVIKI